MAIDINPVNIQEVLMKKAHPSIVMWNRLEGRPRTHHFNVALKAEVRDALWMLSRQWQLGEFNGDDAGSPVSAKIHIASSGLDTFQTRGGNVLPYQSQIPLEAQVEKKNISFTRGSENISIDIRLQMGKYWLKLMKKHDLDFAAVYIANYGFSLPEKIRASDHIYAHRDVWQQYSAISNRCMDGYKFYEHLAGGGVASADISETEAIATRLNTLGEKFVAWYQSIYLQPTEGDNAWIPERLEYQFECTDQSGRERKTLRAEEYFHGHLDWYAFNIKETSQNDLPPKTYFTDSFIPSQIDFDGMPDTRWWKFEDGKTSFGDISPSTTEIAKLLLIEFGLIYANDWFVVPHTLPVGSIVNIEGLVVKNNFGESIWIEASEKPGTANAPWSMFKLHAGKLNNTLFLPPSSVKVHEGSPLESVMLIRDEMSNMVWGLESVVPMPTGIGEKGREVGIQTLQFHEKFVEPIALLIGEAQFYLDHLVSITSDDGALDPLRTELRSILSALRSPDPNVLSLAQRTALAKAALKAAGEDIKFETGKNSDYKANISYLAMTGVPENWIPFVPVHKANNGEVDSRQIQLQRASMLRIIDGDPLQPIKVKPKTSILREGLDNEDGSQTPYYIHEEEVPRSGVRVTQAFQRTRSANGDVFVWLGMKKTVGRGEGQSGLAFDQIKPT